MIVPIQDHSEFETLSVKVRQLSPDRRGDLDATLGGRFDAERTLTVEDIASILNVHVVTVRRRVRTGELKRRASTTTFMHRGQRIIYQALRSEPRSSQENLQDQNTLENLYKPC